MGMYDRDWYRDRYRRKPEPAGTAFKAGDKLPGDGKSKPKAEKPRKSERISGLKKLRTEQGGFKDQHRKIYYDQKEFRGSKDGFLHGVQPPDLSYRMIAIFLGGIIVGCSAFLLTLALQPTLLLPLLTFTKAIIAATGLSS